VATSPGAAYDANRNLR
jgi:hypothetical protein